MKCLSCNSSKLILFLTIDNAPRYVERLLSRVDQNNKKITLKIYKCLACTLVQLPEISYMDDSYYEDYLMSRTYSKFSQRYQTSLAKSFVEQFNLNKKSILEVGCGDGYFATKLQKFGSKVLGVEPSAKAVLLARKRKVKVIHAYVDDNLKVSEKFDAFTTCQVFEHIREPGRLLTNIKRFLKSDQAYGLIEVPSLVKTLSFDRFYDFFPDHVAYYTPASLSYMLNLNGFDVVDIRHTANDEYITAFFKTNKYFLSSNKIQNSFTNYRGKFRSFFKKLSKKKIALWGAGGKGVAVISFSNVRDKNILYCVDSDPNKQGHFLNGTIKIVSPTNLKLERPDVVVITAMMYKDEIINTLKKEYGFTDKSIAIIAPTPAFINE